VRSQTATSGETTRLLDVNDVVSLRKLQAIQMSPDGTRIAFVLEEPHSEAESQQTANTDIWLINSDGSNLRRLTKQAGRVFSPQWSPDGRSLAYLGADVSSNGTQIFLAPVESGEPRVLTAHLTSISSFSWSPDERHIAFLASADETDAIRKRRELGYDQLSIRRSGPDEPLRPSQLWRLDVQNRTTSRIMTGELQLLGLQWGPDSKQLLLTVAEKAEADPEQLRQRLILLNMDSGSSRTYCDVEAKIQGVSWSPDRKSVAFQSSSPGAADPFPGSLYACREGQRPEALVVDTPYTVDSFRWMPDGQSLFLVITQGAHRAFAQLTLNGRHLSRWTKPPLEVAFRSSYSLSRDGKRVACILTSGVQAPDIWLVEADGFQKQLTHVNPELSGCRFGESSEVTWKSRDGMKISGVLIKPPGYEEGSRVPLVVQVHGSQVADVNEFQGSWMNWGQLLASKGYAVLLPNYRGSLTDGARFARANQGDLGGKDFEDILDGVDALVNRGIADSERLGIGGVSYGGFLTAWAVTQSSRFKAAVMGLGIGNWVSMAGQTPGPEGMVRFYWLQSPYERSDLFWSRSPLAYVQRVKAPTLIYAGERDPLVPVSQSREFFRALQHFKVPSELIIYPREGHSIQEPNHLRDNLNRILNWYDRYLRNAP